MLLRFFLFCFVYLCLFIILEVSHGAAALTHFSLTHIAATLLTHCTALVLTHSIAILIVLPHWCSIYSGQSCKIDLLSTQNQLASRTTYLSKSESMASKKPTHRCQFCSKPFAIQRALNHHILASKTCYKEWRKGLVRNEQPSLKRPCRNSPSMDDIFDGFDTQDVDDFVPPPPPGTPPT